MAFDSRHSLYALFCTRGLAPFTLAFLLNFLLSPLVRGLKGIRVPEPLGAAIVLVALLGGIVYGTVTLSKPASDWIQKAPESLPQIEQRAWFMRGRANALVPCNIIYFVFGENMIFWRQLNEGGRHVAQISSNPD